MMTGADLFWEKSTTCWLLVAGLLWEKSTAGWWLISQANRALVKASCSLLWSALETFSVQQLLCLFVVWFIYFKRKILSTDLWCSRRRKKRSRTDLTHQWCGRLLYFVSKCTWWEKEQKNNVKNVLDINMVLFWLTRSLVRLAWLVAFFNVWSWTFLTCYI
jgi:hypothetical protein